MKRWIALFLCLALLVAAAPKAAAAKVVSDTEKEMTTLAKNIFSRCQKTSGRTSFHGYCGNFVSHQLYNLRINKRLYTTDGNKHYDYYSKLEKTTGGYYIKTYDAQDYSLLGTLNAITRNGTQDAYNILVGFQWTNTEAGAKYGHVVLIYGIVDGVVYFSESFPTGFAGYRPEGSLIACSMTEFFNAYDKWTIYEGSVVFGSGAYSEGCDETGTNLILQARFDSTLRSQPCVLGSNDCTALRAVSAGERLQATGVLVNPDGQTFYRIAREGEQEGFVAASAVAAVSANAQDLSLTKLTVPEVVVWGEDGAIGGSVEADLAQVGSVEITVTDSEDQLIFREQMDTRGYQANLSGLNELLRLDLLDQGLYTLRVFAEVACPTAQDQVLYSRACLGGSVFQVSIESLAERSYPQVQGYLQQTDEGWAYDDGWRFYVEGTPQTGWVYDRGVAYYLDENGKALTGWQTVDSTLRYFTATGAMVTDCTLANGEIVYVLNSDGIAQALITEE